MHKPASRSPALVDDLTDSVQFRSRRYSPDGRRFIERPGYTCCTTQQEDTWYHLIPPSPVAVHLSHMPPRVSCIDGLSMCCQYIDDRGKSMSVTTSSSKYALLRAREYTAELDLSSERRHSQSVPASLVKAKRRLFSLLLSTAPG